MGVQSRGWEVPLEEDMATHSSILAWEIPWTEEPGGPQSLGSHKSRTGQRACTAKCGCYQQGWDRSSSMTVD